MHVLISLIFEPLYTLSVASEMLQLFQKVNEIINIPVMKLYSPV